ncbi:hypothetical protein APHAL10511_000449 [Amanita phalloides]|nr:hypothetical protein APHAL10511_000449 [Amanita phalloides]
MESSSTSTELHVPRPTYRIPAYSYALRRSRGRKIRIPQPRSPFVHFELDCIFQRFVTTGAERNYAGTVRAIRDMWLRLSYEQRSPWIRMAEQDVRTIDWMYGDGACWPALVPRKLGIATRRLGVVDLRAPLSEERETSADKLDELPFLEAYRQRYGTPERSTYY